MNHQLHRRRVVPTLLLSALVAAPALQAQSNYPDERRRPIPPVPSSAPGATGERFSQNLRGTVFRRFDDRFYEIRDERGSLVRLVLDINATRRLNAGDRIEIRGRQEGDIIIGYDVIPLDGTLPNPAGETVIRGTIARDLPDRNVRRDEFEVRAEDGRLLQVIADDELTNRFAVGDRVELRGRFIGNRFEATSLIRQGTDAPGGGDYTDRVDFSGTVSRILNANRLEVRGDNGRMYTVDLRNATGNAVRVGDQVRLIGTVAPNGTVWIDQIIRVGAGGGGTGFGQAVDFPATVVSSTFNELRVRGDNGQIYNVRHNQPRAFQAGLRVRVVGTSNGNSIDSTSVTVINGW